MSKPKRKSVRREPVEAKVEIVMPTKERFARAGAEAEVILGKEGSPTVIRQTPFDRMVSRNVLEFEQKLAGERLQMLWHIAGCEVTMSSVDLNRVHGGDADGKGMPRSEREAAARHDLRRGFAILSKRARDVVIKVICEDSELLWVGQNFLGWKDIHQARAAALENVRIGLDMLAIEWGLVNNLRKAS